jgi:Ca2+-binding RTX toxin-like protein
MNTTDFHTKTGVTIMAIITGTTGNDNLGGTTGDDDIIGLAGNDTISAGNGNDNISGGEGNDLLYGGTGDDTYHFNHGDGHDIITELSGYDVIRFGTLVDLPNISIYRNVSNQLVIELDTGDTITSANHFSSAAYAIEEISFDDATSLNLLTYQYNTYGSSGNDNIGGITLNGSVNDIIYGFNGNDTINGGNGNDFIYGGNDNDTISGGDGDDYLDGGNGNDSLNGGNGSDTYYFSSTSGIDTAIEYVGAASGTDIIKTEAGIDLSNLTMFRQGNNDLVIQYDTNNKITLQNHFTLNAAFETLLFDDLTAINLTTQQYNTYGTSGNDTLNGIVYNGSTIDVMYGLDGNDTLNTGNGDDYLDGGNGNDTLYGGSGNDTYYFGTTSGIDIASEYAVPSSGSDTIKLGAGIDLSDLTIFRQGSADLIIQYDANNKITLQNHFTTTTSGFETLLFDDTTTLNLTTQQYDTYGTIGNDYINGIIYNGSTNDIMYGLDGNDILNGNDGNDFLYGGIGNDILNGGNNNDILYGGDGLDTLSGGTGSDTFVFEAASAFNNIDVIQDFNRSQGDKLDISDLLIGYTSGVSDINDFVSLSTTSGNTTVLIDRDGTGGSYSDQSITVLNSSSGYTVDDLFNNNHFII